MTKKSDVNYVGVLRMKILDDYLENILYKQLREVNMPYRFIKQIAEDIKLRMLSCLAYWHDAKIRKTILFPSLEEALYYEPDNVQPHIREFVVTTIRNSMLEVAASLDYHTLKLSEPLSDQQIKSITSEAIRYFDHYAMEMLADSSENIENVQNVYGIAMEKYPLAWCLLQEIANLEEQEKELEIIIPNPVEGGGQKKDVEQFLEGDFNKDIQNGFSVEFGEALKQRLRAIAADMSDCFYADCFKMVARNFEKVLHVLQIVLEYDKVFCTCNYFISRDYIEKRRNILRAAHNNQETNQNMRHEGAPEAIRAYMDALLLGN